jgi:TolB-like protein
MKKAVFILLALFAITRLFAQQQPVVAVVPFDVISGVSTTDATMITDVFFVRLGNTRKVDLVNRTIVQRVIKEHNFQLEDWSDKEKTAELGKALNADWIVQGDIRKMNNGILIIVQFYNIKTFKFEGGTDVRLANADEAYDKMNPLVDSLIQTIAASPAPVSLPPKTPKVKETWTPNGTIFEGYTVYNKLGIFGYTFSPDLPLGFSLGFFGIYTSLAFSLSEFGRYIESSSEGNKPKYGSSSYTDQSFQIIDWLIGYNFTIIPKMLYLPVGFGIESVREWRFQTYEGLSFSSGWRNAPKWETNIIIETGLLFRPTNKIEFPLADSTTFSPYIFGSYRFIIPNKHSFSIGGGISFEEM